MNEVINERTSEVWAGHSVEQILRAQDRKSVVIFDIDGTLFDDSHRNDFARRKEWDEYHSRLMDDAPHEAMVELAGMLTFQIIVALTTRPEKYRQKTIEKLRKHNVEVDILVMRDDNDFRSSPKVKTSWAVEAFGSVEAAKEKILLIIDDREDVIEAFLAMGISALLPRVS